MARGDPRPGDARLAPPAGSEAGRGAGRDEVLVEVRILSFPIDLYQRAREHNEGLMREFTLIRLSEPESIGVPHRLVQLAEALTQRFAAFTAVPESQLAEAEARGDERINLLYQVPPDVADAVTRYGALLDEADEFCRSGQHLLTLVAPPDVVSLRQWFFQEFVGQTVGKDATSWPEWQRIHGAPQGAPQGAPHGAPQGATGTDPPRG